MNKKEFLIIVLLQVILGNTHSFSQTTIDLEHNAKRNGDNVELYKIQTDDIWDLSSSVQCEKTKYERNENFKEDTIAVFFNGSRKYYQYHCDSLIYLGIENPQSIEYFYLPEVSCIFPISLGDSLSGYLASHVSYCDKLILHKYGIYTIVADSLGTLILRNGNTIDNALQISRKRQYTYEQLDSCDIENLPMYSKLDIMEKQSEGTEFYTEVERELYLKGYRYPIVRDLSLYNPKGELCFKETYYSSPEEQEHLSLDDPNIEARKNMESNDYSDPQNDNFDIFSFVNNSIGTMEIIFDVEGYLSACQQNGTTQCRLILSDNMGIVYRTNNYSVDSSSNPEICLSYSGLRHGQYVLSIEIDKQVYTNNFIVE